MNKGKTDEKREDLNAEKCICSFCGKSHKEVPMLIAGPNDVFICDGCVGICSNIVSKYHLNISELKPEKKERKKKSGSEKTL
jgi:ATP-dependent protease Clp ATPase subunit